MGGNRPESEMKLRWRTGVEGWRGGGVESGREEGGWRGGGVEGGGVEGWRAGGVEGWRCAALGGEVVEEWRSGGVGWRFISVRYSQTCTVWYGTVTVRYDTAVKYC